MPLSPPDRDHDRLVARVAAGDPQAQDAFCRLHWPAVYRVCFGVLVDRAEAEDVAQEALVHLIDRAGEFEAGRRFDAWRNAVVVNLCRDRLRRSRTRRRAEDAARARALPALLPDPHAEAERAEVQEILASSLAALTEREREVFVLRELEGQDGNDVAAALGITAGTVRSLACLARQRLKRLLGARLPEYAGGDRGSR